MSNAAHPLLKLLQFEREAREAKNRDQFHFFIVNRLRTLIPHQQSALFHYTGHGFKLTALSDVPTLDPHAPFVRWLDQLVLEKNQFTKMDQPQPLTPDILPAKISETWSEWFPSHALWVPLIHPNQEKIGALLLGRNTPWQEAEQVLLQQLSPTMAHAWSALFCHQSRWFKKLSQKRILLLSILITIILLALPVPQSVLAPAKVVAQTPWIVAAPFNGVIKKFHIIPNQPVNKGDALFSFEPDEIENQYAVAQQNLALSEAKKRSADQGAFMDRQKDAESVLLQEEIKLRRLEATYALSKVSQLTVFAERTGVAIFRDTNDWLGRPVTLGERILQIAHPKEVELEIELPTQEAVTLQLRSPVKLFLDIDPLTPRSAQLTRIAYEPVLAGNNLLIYPVRAQFLEQSEKPRLGLQGTAKIIGQSVTLFYYLFRRPLASLRQTVGW
ncbi:efflux RND transporter periplasmic adaptor subunit [Magnetococcales bacterium HHB-1]